MINVLTPLLLNNPYNAAEATHNLVGLIASRLAYVASYSASFPRPTRPQAYDTRIRGDTKNVDSTCAKQEWTTDKE